MHLQQFSGVLQGAAKRVTALPVAFLSRLLESFPRKNTYVSQMNNEPDNQNTLPKKKTIVAATTAFALERTKSWNERKDTIRSHETNKTKNSYGTKEQTNQTNERIKRWQAFKRSSRTPVYYCIDAIPV